MPFAYSNEFKIFLKRASVFLLPVLIVFGILDALAIYTGELMPVDTVVSRQIKDPNILYGRKVVDQELKRYKYELYTKRGGDILAIGSSRILAMREEFFEPYYEFTNVGSIAHNIGDVADFVSRMPRTEERKIVFLSVDYYWFGDARTALSALTRDLELPNAAYDYRAHIFASRHILSTLLNDTDKFLAYIYPKEFDGSFGFQGREGNGYRGDGSYSYGTTLKELRVENKYIDREGPPVIERVRSGSGSYAFNSSFDPSRVTLLDQVLKELKDKNYYVIGLNLPFSTEVYAELQSNPGHRDLYGSFEQSMPKVFADNGFRYFDYADLRRLNLSDLYMFDGVHASETATAHIVTAALRDLSEVEMPHRNEVMANLKTIILSPATKSFELGLMGE